MFVKRTRAAVRFDEEDYDPGMKVGTPWKKLTKMMIVNRVLILLDVSVRRIPEKPSVTANFLLLTSSV
jgi:hypothetical protein